MAQSTRLTANAYWAAQIQGKAVKRWIAKGDANKAAKAAQEAFHAAGIAWAALKQASWKKDSDSG